MKMCTIHIDHHFHIDHADAARLAAALAPLLLASWDQRMSKLNDDLNAAVDRATAAFDAALVRVQGDVATLNKAIEDLTAKLAAGGLTADEATALQGKIDDLTAKLAAIDPTDPATLPEEP
jgi:predicted RecB family endonuclease